MTTEFKAEILAEQVAYQPGSIVSKTLIDKKSGTVTLFAIAAGQGLSEHTAPFDALVCVLDGTVEITVAGQPVAVNQGQMLILPAHKPHALKAVTQFKMMLVMIRS